MDPSIIPASDTKPGDFVEDAQGHRRQVTDIQVAGDEFTLHADDDLRIVTGRDHQLRLPGLAAPATPPALKIVKPKKKRDTSDFQSNSTVQGRLFDQQCRLLIRHADFSCSPKPIKIKDLGIEIDAEIVGPNGGKLWCEFKGSFLGDRPGASRTDTLVKAIGCASLAWSDKREQRPPFVLLTSHLPRVGSSGWTMLQCALAVGIFWGVINLNEAGAEKRLRALEP